MSDAVARIARPPVMRRMLESSTKKHLVGAITFSILVGLTWRFAVGDVRKAKYAAFYRDYDAERDFEIMRKKGLFNSC